MTTKEFIERAIEGGWRWKYYPENNPKFHIQDEMKDKSGVVAVWDDSSSSFFIDIRELLLDPLAWQAVGKVEGWDKRTYRVGIDTEASSIEFAQNLDGWQWNMHRMIDALCEGRTIEQYLETL